MLIQQGFDHTIFIETKPQSEWASSGLPMQDTVFRQLMYVGGDGAFWLKQGGLSEEEFVLAQSSQFTVAITMVPLDVVVAAGQSAWLNPALAEDGDPVKEAAFIK